MGSWYNNTNEITFTDATQILEGGANEDIEDINSDITTINNSITDITNVFIPKVLNIQNGSLDTIIVNNTANSRIFLKNNNSEPKVKIEGGKLYLYYDYDFTNAPTIPAGWTDILAYAVANRQTLLLHTIDLIAIDTYLFSPLPLNLPAKLIAIDEEILLNSGLIASLQSRMLVAEGEIVQLISEFFGQRGADIMPDNTGGITAMLQQMGQVRERLRVNRENYMNFINSLPLPTNNPANLAQMTQGIANIVRSSGEIASAGTAFAYQLFQNVFIGFGVAGVALTWWYLDSQKERLNIEKEGKLIITYEKLLTVEQSNIINTIHLTGLIIYGGNNLLGNDGTYTPTISNGGKLEIKIINGLAVITSVIDVGTPTLTVGQIISIPKTALGGVNTGTLDIQITSLISARQAIREAIEELKTDKETIQNRRRLREGVINKNEFGDGLTIAYNSTLTNAETGEVLQVPTIKLNLNPAQLETINGVLNIKDYVNLTNIASLTDYNYLQDEQLVKIKEILLPNNSTLTTDTKVNLGYKNAFLGFPYDLIMLAIKSDTYTTFNSADYLSDFLGYFPNMARLALSGDIQVVKEVSLTVSGEYFNSGLIYLKNTNTTKSYNFNRKVEFITFLKMNAMTPNTTYTILQNGIETDGIYSLNTTNKIGISIRNNLITFNHPAMVSYNLYGSGSINNITANLTSQMYFQLLPLPNGSDNNIVFGSSPIGESSYRYFLELASVPYRNTNGTEYINTPTALIKVTDSNNNTNISNDSKYIQLYLSDPDTMLTPLGGNTVYPSIQYFINEVPNWYIQKLVITFDVYFYQAFQTTETTFDNGYPVTTTYPAGMYQRDMTTTRSLIDLDFKIIYSFDMITFNEVILTFDTLSAGLSAFAYPEPITNVNIGWNSATMPKRYITAEYIFPNTQPYVGQKLKNVQFKLIKKPTQTYTYGTTVNTLYHNMPVISLYKFELKDYALTATESTTALYNNYSTTDTTPINITSPNLQMMTFRTDLPNNNLSYYINDTLYNMTPRNDVIINVGGINVSASFVSWANLSLTNNILVVGNTPTAGNLQFSHFNWRFFQATEAFLTLTEIQKLMTLKNYNYYQHFVNVDKLLDVNELSAISGSFKRLIVGNRPIIEPLSSGRRSLSLRSDQTEEVANVLIEINKLYVENPPIISGALSYDYLTRQFYLTYGLPVSDAVLNSCNYITANALVNYVSDAELSTCNYLQASALSSYVLTTSLNTTLNNYVSDAELSTCNYLQASALSPYVLTTSLNTTLNNYVSDAELSTCNYIKASALSPYALTTALDDYVTNTALTNANYVTANALVPYVLTTTLANANYITTSALSPYVLTTSLNTTLNNYVSDAELSTCNYLKLTNLPLATSTTSGIMKVDDIITTTTNNVLKLVEPASYTMTNQETVSRSYPPTRDFTGPTGTATAISGQAYGNGTYIIRFSTFGSVNYYPSECFRTSDVLGGLWGYGQYSSVGVYTSTNYLVSGYLGDWVTIEMPYAIRLTSYKLQLHTSFSANIYRPTDFKIYASNDNITWVTIDTITGCTYIDITTEKYFEKNVTVSIYYRYYGLAVNKVSSTGNQCQLNELYFFGVEPAPNYLYKKDAFLKYTAGVQVEATRNTGTWGITDYVSGTQVSTATSVSLGVVKGGNNVSIATDGTMSVVIPTATTATTSTLGVVKGGGNVSIATDGTMSVTIPTATIATATTTGIVKGGANISIDGTGMMTANIPIATTTLGLVKNGGNVTIDGTGNMNVTHPVLPTFATSSVAGIVKSSPSVSVDGTGIMSVNLPTIATTLVAGTVKASSTISVDALGVMTANIPTGTNTVLGLVKGGGQGITISGGVINAQIATASVLGSVKQGTNINIDANGLISATIPAEYITQTALNTTLNNYVSDAELSTCNYLQASALSPYVLTTSLNTTLNNYVTNTTLTNANYIDSTELTNALTTYVTETELTNFNYITPTTLNYTLTSYVTDTELNNFGYITNSALTNLVSDAELSTCNFIKLSDIPKGTNSVYGLCRGGTGVSVDNGIINVSIPSEYIVQSQLTNQLLPYTPLTTYNDYINSAVGNTYFIEITWIYADGSFKFSGSDRNTTYTDFLVISNKGLTYNLNDIVKIITISANQTGSTYYTPRVSMWMTNSMLPHNQIDNGSYTGGTSANPDANYWIVNHLSEQVIYTYQNDERFNQILTYGNDAGGRLKYLKINTATATQTTQNKRADFYTRAEIDKKDYIIPNTISKYAITPSLLTTSLLPYATISSLSGYGFAMESSLANLVSDAELSTCNYIKATTLSSYALKTEVSSSYATIASLANLVSDAELSTCNYITASALSPYALTTSLNTTLNNYVTNTALTNANYIRLVDIPTATSSVKGICRPDNSSVVINNGVLSVGSVVQAWKTNNWGIYYNDLPANVIGVTTTANIIIGSQNNSSTDANSPIILPDAKLYVRDDKPTTNILFRGGTVGGTGGKLRIYMTTDSSYSSLIESEHIGGGQTKLSLATNYNGALTNKMTITPEGTVGINVINPNIGYKLDVAGGINSSSLNTGAFNCSSLAVGGVSPALSSFSGNINRNRVDELYLAINERFAFVVPASVQYNYGATLKESLFRIPVNLHLNRYNNYGNYQSTGSGISAQYYMSLQPNSVFGRFQHYFGLVRMAWMDGDSLASGNSLSHYELLSNNTNDWDTNTWGGYSVMGVFYIQVSVYTSAYLNELNVILH